MSKLGQWLDSIKNKRDLKRECLFYQLKPEAVMVYNGFRPFQDQTTSISGLDKV